MHRLEKCSQRNSTPQMRQRSHLPWRRKRSKKSKRFRSSEDQYQGKILIPPTALTTTHRVAWISLYNHSAQTICRRSAGLTYKLLRLRMIWSHKRAEMTSPRPWMWEPGSKERSAVSLQPAKKDITGRWCLIRSFSQWAEAIVLSKAQVQSSKSVLSKEAWVPTRAWGLS